MAINRFWSILFRIVYQNPEQRFDAEPPLFGCGSAFKIRRGQRRFRLPEFRVAVESKRALIT